MTTIACGACTGHWYQDTNGNEKHTRNTHDERACAARNT